ncbi:MAG: TIGR01212 family radical SAM protein [Dysgonamonadaceae bacterium]|jgi:radical SAM protein (TIGR01212 family)|nr:TIGR01212 family radical SAM protein [Dysgonamonadaceae bacterium]
MNHIHGISSGPHRPRSIRDFLATHFPFKVQKISINAGFTCPNRDGTKGFGGCTYCNNQTFSPQYAANEKTVSRQLEEGIRFFSHKYPKMKYIAYFQAYTNTYDETEKLLEKYNEALNYPDVVGLIIGTRPDCMPEDLLNELKKMAQKYFLLIEYGVESTHDETLKLINRQHTYQEAVDAISRTHEKDILCGVHLILGLPGESREMILSHADRVSELPLKTLKLHQLQLIRHTKMAKQFEETPELFHLYTVDEYIELCIDFMERLNPEIIIERFVSQSPKELLIAPDWGLKNNEFAAKIEKRMKERQTFPGKTN